MRDWGFWWKRKSILKRRVEKNVVVFIVIVVVFAIASYSIWVLLCFECDFDSSFCRFCCVLLLLPVLCLIIWARFSTLAHLQWCTGKDSQNTRFYYCTFLCASCWAFSIGFNFVFACVSALARVNEFLCVCVSVLLPCHETYVLFNGAAAANAAIALTRSLVRSLLCLLPNVHDLQ